MSFYKPYYLYLLLLVPLLLFLYMLKLKRKTQVVSSVILWEQAIDDIKANALFQRLRRNILLPLQILFLTLAIFALARPFWAGQGIMAKNVILIIDGSASMRADDIKPSRFESAKLTALKIIQDMEKGGKMMIIEAKSSPKIITDFTTDRVQLKDFIAKMSPADTTTDLESSIQLASSIIKDLKESQILLLSDGGGNISHEAIPPDTNIRFVSFGKDNPDNLGITQFEVATSPLYPSKFQAFVVIQNFSSTEKRNVNLELYGEKSLIDVRELNLASGERRSVIFDNIGHSRGLLKVFIDVKDDLYTDNSAYFLLGEDKPSRALIVSKGNLFLQKAIETSSVKLDKIYQKPEFYSVDRTYELFIFESFVPEKLPEGNILLINPGPYLPFGKVLSQSNNPEIINWDRESPIMRFVDLTNLKIDKFYKYEMPVWMKPLVESDMGTMAWIGENVGHRIIVLPFEIRPGISNNFPMLVAFPIFIDNAINWLLGLDKEHSQFKAGESLRLSIPKELENQNLTIKKPDGQAVKAQVREGAIVFSDTDQVGVYSVAGNGFKKDFAVNLLSDLESNIKPAGEFQIGSREISSSSPYTSTNREIWAILIMIGIIILAIEWWAYHRRVLV